MSLKNIIIEKYQEDLDEKTKGFLFKAKEALRDKISEDLGLGYDINALLGESISPKEAKIEIDELHFKVYKEERLDSSGLSVSLFFNLLIKCGRCSNEFEKEMRDLVSIGKILKDPLCEICQKAKNLDLNIFYGLVRFLKEPKWFEKFGKRITIDKQHVIQTDFLKAYNTWAKSKSYPVVEKLSELGELQSLLLNKQIRPKTIYFEDLNKEKKVQEYGLYFYLGEIETLLSEKK